MVHDMPILWLNQMKSGTGCQLRACPTGNRSGGQATRNGRAGVGVNDGNLTTPCKSACVSVDKPVLLPVVLVSGRVGGSIRFGPPSLVRFLAGQEMNEKASRVKRVRVPADQTRTGLFLHQKLMVVH